MTTTQPLSREQLAQTYQWSQFSDNVQNLLFHHYQRFSHNGDFGLALSDIQSASDTLSWVQQGEKIGAFLQEHLQYFGQESTDDLANIARQLVHS